MTVFHAIVELSKASWRVLRAHPRLVWFPLLSLATVLGLLLWLAPILTADDDETPWLVLLILTGVSYLTHVFYSVAITNEALKALRGERPSIADGLGSALGRLPAIATFSLITGTVGFVIGMIGRSRHAALRFARSIVETGWSLATYLAIPVMVQERRGGFTSLRRSSDLFKRTWGETTLSEVGVRVLTAQLGFILVLIAIVLMDLLGDSLGILVAFVVVVGAIALIGALEAIYRAALYVFAAEGVIPASFAGPELGEIWKTKDGDATPPSDPTPA